MSENSRINPEVIIIGAGLNGSMLTKVLRAQGVQVLLIDSKKPLSGSKCSSGMWRTGWVSKSIEEKVEEGLENLHEFGGIQVIQCENLDPIKQKPKVGRPSEKLEKPIRRIDDLMFVDWRDICDVESDNFEVISVHNNMVTCYRQELGNHNEKVKTKFVARLGVFICAGAYTDEILEASNYPVLGLDKYFGSCIESTDRTTPNSVIKTWAPYKQTLAARMSKTVMKFSDGSMVKNPPESGDERCSNIHDRLHLHIAEIMGDKYKLVNAKNIYGMRPYMPKEHKGDFVNQHDKNLFSCTGTAKNTTILCGYIAKVCSGIVEDWRVADRKRNKVK